jgi:putative PIN family toxin of toxin-antitoxin system
VPDSVVWISAFLTPGGLAAALIERCRGRVELVSSEAILDEVREVLLERRHLRARFPYDEPTVARYLRDIRGIVELAAPADVPVFERDPKDTKLLACAVGADADFLITRDLDLLDLKIYRKTAVVSPEELIRRLRDESSGE